MAKPILVAKIPFNYSGKTPEETDNKKRQYASQLRKALDRQLNYEYHVLVITTVGATRETEFEVLNSENIKPINQDQFDQLCRDMYLETIQEVA